ncbi:phage holin family protein [Echinicola jeungdonensis]|uniref:Phage holin family protein n=1 Tax=Echinicola jeungdonensis TaxID=709343 RepID=A0ABV5J220_9BACT|nr:phage holin family protein [Echinicola jeungdonensis]MDN3669016.1 phage holin family protein [Echinicola jeungdonensis]
MLNFSEIGNTIKKLIEVRIQILKKDIEEELSSIVTRITILILMVIASILVLLFASLALAFYFGELTYSNYLGFLYVALIYLLFFLILYIIKDQRGLQNGIQNVLKKFVFFSKNNKKTND